MSCWSAHNGKQPKTIYTDQDTAMAKAEKIVFTRSYHGLCTFHIMQDEEHILLILVLVCMIMRTRKPFKKLIVEGDPINQTTSCSCGMFNRTGILCAHSIKVLDLMNIKILPTHYVLKRWTRDARNGSILDIVDGS